MWPYPPRVAPALRAPANQSGPWDWGFHAVRGGVDPTTQENSIFVPGVSEVERYGRMSEPGMGPNASRVRRDWGGLPRRATLAARALPPDWPRADREERSANGIEAQKTQG